MTQKTSRQTLAYVIAWVVSSLGTVLDLWLVGTAIVQATIWIGAHRTEASRRAEWISGGSFGWTVELVAQVTLFILVCVGIALVLWLEYHYRSAPAEMLARRLRKVSLVQLTVAAASLVAVGLTWLVR